MIYLKNTMTCMIKGIIYVKTVNTTNVLQKIFMYVSYVDV